MIGDSSAQRPPRLCACVWGAFVAGESRVAANKRSLILTSISAGMHIVRQAWLGERGMNVHAWG
jgi:hypothetical protein